VAFQDRIYLQKDGGARLFYFDVVINALRPFSTLQYGQGAATAGDKLAMNNYKDGATVIPFLYLRRAAGVELFRMMVIR
jgi:hypothetical protein